MVDAADLACLVSRTSLAHGLVDGMTAKEHLPRN